MWKNLWRKHSKKISLGLVFLLIIGITLVGYAVLSRTLDITGSSKVKSNTWDIHFENIVPKEGNIEAVK